MRSVLFISLLLLLSTLFNEAQGRHLRKGGDLPARNHKTNENGSIRRSDQGSKGENKIDECKDEAMKTKVSRATKLPDEELAWLHNVQALQHANPTAQEAMDK
nr:uncharacterized protein LOC109174816 [Ipomoea batatas]